MTYWMNGYALDAQNSWELLAIPNANGNCQSWSGLLRDLYRLHGITANRISVWSSKPKVDAEVAVKIWQFVGSGSTGQADHPYQKDVDVFDEIGIPGQGNPNPHGSFNGHWITESGTTYYDPSYGTPSISGTNRNKLYEDSAFDGYIGFYVSGGYQFTLLRKNDTTPASLSEATYLDAN